MQGSARRKFQRKQWEKIVKYCTYLLQDQNRRLHGVETIVLYAIYAIDKR